MNYTKGEWKVTREGLIWAKQDDGLQFHHRIALIENGEEAEANANLIAAAPAMYEALKLFDAYLTADYPGNMMLEQAAEAMEEVLAKAEPSQTPEASPAPRQERRRQS